MSNNFDEPILLDSGLGTPGAPGDYLGFGRAAAGVVSTGSRVYAGTGFPLGTLTAPSGSLWLATGGNLWQNVDGGTTWSQVGGEGQVIADPGDGNAIPVTNSGTISFTTGAVGETNSLVNPSYSGQILVLVLDTDGGGDRVVTADNPINRAGNTIMTFANAGEFIKLQGAPVGGALRWLVIANDSVALS